MVESILNLYGLIELENGALGLIVFKASACDSQSPLHCLAFYGTSYTLPTVRELRNIVTGNARFWGYPDSSVRMYFPLEERVLLFKIPLLGPTSEYLG